MQNWNYSPDEPVSITLAADSRLCRTDYLNDHIWELKLGSTDPPSISLETTFGLRARLCRIFPRFIIGDKVVNDPKEFSQPIIINRYFPNYIELSFKPFSHINVKLEYWVPGSQMVAGRIKIKNTSHNTITIQMEWSELLLSSSDGFRMTVNEIGMNTLLTGKTSNLSPVLFVTGGAQSGKSSYPSLNLPISIEAHEEKEARWVHATFEDANTSIMKAKDLCNNNWEAEFARITRVNSKSLEIFTGNKYWDLAFGLSQNLAYQLILQPIRSDLKPSCVTIRNPDQGFSMLKDGSDYNHLWNGLSSLEAQYLLNLFLPESPGIIENLFDNFLITQNSSGEIDLKPGLGGQLNHTLATPVLADIALQLYEYSGDLEYLKTVFPKILSFFLSWFSLNHDRDDDQIPEWDQIVQSGYEDHPLFSQINPKSIGADVSTVESPDLISYLYRECLSLISIASQINGVEAINQLEEYSQKLKLMIDNSWSDQDICYHYRDRDSHHTTTGEYFTSRKGEGSIDLHQEFIHPIRPIIHITSKDEITKPCQIFIHGKGISGTHRIENITASRIHWHNNIGYVTSKYSYLSIERVEVNGVLPGDTVSISSIDLSRMDLSLALPLWANIPSKERAKILINLTIMNMKKFLSPFGLRNTIDIDGTNEKSEEAEGINLPRIALILEGMLHYDERPKAGETFQRLMKPITRSIQQNITLHQSYRSETGAFLGAQNSISSLVPIGLFLKILGVKIYNPHRVEIEGHNPFPWPVTIKYQGLTIIKHEKKTFIVFPDGQSVTINNDKKQLISMETSSD